MSKASRQCVYERAILNWISRQLKNDQISVLSISIFQNHRTFVVKDLFCFALNIITFPWTRVSDDILFFIKIRTSVSTGATQMWPFLLVNDFYVMSQSPLLTKCPLTYNAYHFGNPALTQLNWQSWISLD